MIRSLTLALCLIATPAFSQMTHDNHSNHGASQATSQPMEAGQAAFAAIQEITAILRADPETDWAKVNIDALRAHLVDMNSVTLSAQVQTEIQSNKLVFTVTGSGATKGAIQRMVLAHASIMKDANGWEFSATKIAQGATLTVSAKDLSIVQGLGFFGIMADGMHHQSHHLQLARGSDPHH